jgi:hypothetical protein
MTDPAADIAALRQELRALRDREAVRDVVHAIARGVDRFDQTLLAASILPHAVFDRGGAEPMTGAAFVAGLKPPAEPRPGRMHVIGNVSVQVDGDTAKSEAYIVSCMDVLKDEVAHTRLRAGRYLDRFRRDGGGWRLSHRIMIDEWSRIDAVVESAPQGRHRGRPAPDDLSYDKACWS